MYSQEKITYNGVYPDGKIVWNDVLYDGEIIGSFGQKNNGIIRSMSFFYQKCVPEEFKDFGDRWYIAEDIGMVFVVFDGFDNTERLYELHQIIKQKSLQD